MSYRKKETTTVVSQKMISEGIYDLRVRTEAAKYCAPGQFVGIFPPSDARILMRPISICAFDSGNEILRMVYRIAGEGTKLISGLKEGDRVDLLSVLGNGFPIEAARGKSVVLMGGGIGIPPMLGTAAALNGEKVSSILGYRNSDLFLSKEFEEYSKVYIATEDGSIGTKGNVLDALGELKEKEGLKPDIIMACGPMPMLRAIKKYAAQNDITAYISLEERMACGVGACLGCVCKTVKKDEHSHVNNTRICTEGPVFNAEDVDI